jgi:hypothetical protein
MSVFRRYSRCLRNLESPVKKTFTYSEKPEEKREEYLNRPAPIPKEDRVYLSE